VLDRLESIYKQVLAGRRSVLLPITVTE
jgi:hypothetical protein